MPELPPVTVPDQPEETPQASVKRRFFGTEHVPHKPTRKQRKAFKRAVAL